MPSTIGPELSKREYVCVGVRVGMGGLEWIIHPQVKCRQGRHGDKQRNQESLIKFREKSQKDQFTLISVVFLMKVWC